MKIGVLGTGRMGCALLRGYIKRKSSQSITAYDRDEVRLTHICKELGIEPADSSVSLVEKSEVVLIFVKPKDIHGVLVEIKGVLTPSKLVVSSAAGITTSFIEKIVGDGVPVLRVMPNTCASVGEAVSAISAGRFAKERHKEQTVAIFRTIGKVVEMQEHLMDAVTALSGSGPAYIFFMCEVLCKAGVGLGLSSETAGLLAKQTILGAGKMLTGMEESPQALREAVTSPGGTTESAIRVLKEKHFEEILIEAVASAREKANELQKNP